MLAFLPNYPAKGKSLHPICSIYVEQSQPGPLPKNDRNEDGNHILTNFNLQQNESLDEMEEPVANHPAQMWCNFPKPQLSTAFCSRGSMKSICFSLKVPTTDPRFRTSDIGYRKSDIGHRFSAVGFRTSAIGYRKSEIGNRLSVIGRRTSVIGHRLSDIGHRFSDIGNRKSEIESN